MFRLSRVNGVGKGKYSMSQAQQATGLTTSQLEQLCQAAQIERTMHLLFALNHWAKARDRLFFADRQSLYQLKAAILHQAFTSGAIEAKAYIDGQAGFGAELSFDIAADVAAEGFLWRLEELAASPATTSDDIYARIVCQLYQRMTGKEVFSASEVEALETSRVYEYILEQLQELEREARATGQPIPPARLTELCIAPSDLLYIEGRRYYDLGNWDSWDQLDASDLRKLDPEGLSLIAFEYASSIAHYVFHLPFRLAEAFVPAWFIALLKEKPWNSRESGEYYGRAITESESLQQPVADILCELGADVTAICPHRLSNKEDVLFAQAMRYSAHWPDEFEDEDDEDDGLDEIFWQSIATPDRESCTQSAGVHHAEYACPLCLALVEATSLARAEHWQQEHPDQDLTISQASWVLNRACGKEEFCRQHPPDYRAPHERGWGTRYWRVETLREWMQGEKMGKK